MVQRRGLVAVDATVLPGPWCRRRSSRLRSPSSSCTSRRSSPTPCGRALRVRGLAAPWGGWLADELLLEGFAAILLTALILIGPTLMLLRRWRVPMGSLTLLFGTVAVLQSSLLGFDMGETILAGVVGGFTADLLAQRLQPSASTATVLRVVGLVVPIVVWLTYVGLLATFYSVGWTVEFWSGITVMSGLAGLGLAVLMTLPAPTPTRSSPAAST